MFGFSSPILNFIELRFWFLSTVSFCILQLTLVNVYCTDIYIKKKHLLEEYLKGRRFDFFKCLNGLCKYCYQPQLNWIPKITKEKAKYFFWPTNFFLEFPTLSLNIYFILLDRWSPILININNFREYYAFNFKKYRSTLIQIWKYVWYNMRYNHFKKYRIQNIIYIVQPN